MYISEFQLQYTFTDSSGKPWPRGTIILLEPFPQHCGFVDYTLTGEQVLLHKSRKLGGAVVTGPEDFIDVPTRYRVIVPESNLQADEWLNNAYAGIDVGELWLPFDNCQDFVSQSVTGHKGSPTRDAILGGLFFAGSLGLAATFSPSKQRRRARY
jgi:hypothetical protein